MNNVLFIIGLRATALALLLSGRAREADRLYALADVLEAGKISDDEMAQVAELLKSREITDADWDEAFANIEAAQKRLHGDT